MKIIGIDPDMRNPGTCELHDGVIFDIGSMTTAYLLASIPWYIANDYVFAVENVNEVKGIYTRNQKGGEAVKAKIAQNVGMVKAAGTILIDYIEHSGGKVILAPVGVGRQVKNNPKLFAQLSGHKKRTNEDCRDAWAIAKWAESQKVKK
jgi:hypothetical protein